MSQFRWQLPFRADLPLSVHVEDFPRIRYLIQSGKKVLSNLPQPILGRSGEQQRDRNLSLQPMVTTMSKHT